MAHRDALTDALEDALSAWTAADILAALEQATVPAGPINAIDQTFDDPQIKARGLRIEPEGVPGVRGPWRFSDAELSLEKSAPVLPKGDGAG